MTSAKGEMSCTEPGLQSGSSSSIIGGFSSVFEEWIVDIVRGADDKFEGILISMKILGLMGRGKRICVLEGVKIWGNVSPFLGVECCSMLCFKVGSVVSALVRTVQAETALIETL